MALRSLYREPEREQTVAFGALEYHDVFKIFRSGPTETVALRGLDLRVEQRELVALLGPSGCGKSTALHLAAGLDEPSAGDVVCFGRSLARLDDSELADYRAREIAIVFQSGNLWPALSARENIALTLRLAGRSDDDGALARFGLDGRERQRAGSLSGGEQQRLAIAAAAARQARLVLADEPTAELDERNEQIVLEAFRRLRDELETTVVIVTHSERVADAVDRVIELRDGAVAGMTELAAARAVVVTYGAGDATVRALGGVDLAIAARDSVALLGRSGSGKTTLLHVLGGLVEPSGGVVEWQGKPLSSLDAAARGAVRARGIAYVFQGGNLLPTFTAAENVAFAVRVAESDAEPEELLELVGLTAKAEHLPAELSGGEMQRVALARALAQRPELLLCDEPTGHLDSDTAERVLDLIEALQAEFGFALAIATHDADVAARLRRSVELHDGRGGGSVIHLAVVGLVRAPGAHAASRDHARGRSSTSRSDAAVCRSLAGHDDERSCPQRAARLARPGRLLRRSATRCQNVARQPGVLTAQPVATGTFAGLEHVTPSLGTIRAGAGAILAVPPGYNTQFHTFRFLHGSLKPGGVVFDQQLAATLQAQIGDTVLLTPSRSAKPVRLKVTGIALVTAGDVLFQPLNPLVGPAPAQPPANVAILPLDTFATQIAPALPQVTTANPAVPGTQAGIQWQVQAQVDPGALSGSPSAALTQATQIRNRVERSLPGQVVFVDNLADGLTSAAGDALYAQTLYIMLALPGALVALGLAYLAALGTVERDRRELALLRARGARRRSLLVLAGTESVVLGIVAGALGTALALLAVHLAGSGGGIGAGRALSTFGICVALAVAGAAGARIAAGLVVFRAGIGESRRSTRREQPPLWQRLYLDVLALAVAGLVYWLTARTGFSAVVNPDSNPTLSLSVYMFLARHCSGSALHSSSSDCVAGRWHGSCSASSESAHARGLDSCSQVRAGEPPRSIGGSSWSDCYWLSASSSVSSRRHTTSRPASTRS